MLVDDAQFFLSEARAAATPLEQAEGLLDAAFWTLADGGQRSRDALAFVDEADRTLETLAPGTDDDRARVRVVRQRLGELLLELDEPERAVEQLLGCADSRTELDLGTRVGAALLTAHQLFDMPRALEILDETERELPQRACIAALQLSMHARRRDVDGQIEAATRLGARLRCPRQRASALLAAARLLASRGAAHDARVATLCREATTLDDGSSSARELLVCTAERLGRWDVVVSERATLARVRDGAERTRLLYAAAVAASERLGDQSRARELLVEASREASRELSADRTITLWRLAEMQRGGNCSERERLDTLVKLASATWDRARRAEVLVEAAEVCAHAPSDEVVGGDERAVNYCEQALASEPGYLPALQLLGRIARRRGDLSRLVPVYRREVETLAIPERRALRALECSELSLRIGRLAEAEEALGRVLDLDPENPVAYARLAALLRVRQGWWELARRSARQLEHAKDPSTRAALCKTLDALRARGTEYPLDENERSARAELEPCEPVDLTLFASAAHLALRGQGASRRRDALERIAALEGRAGDSRDATERRWARIEAARLLVALAGDEGDEEDRDGAALLSQAIDLLVPLLASSHPPLAALELAGRVRSMQGRWREVIALHERERELVAGLTGELDADLIAGEQALLLCRVAQVWLEQLGDAKRAARLYSEALELRPRCLSAITGLDRALARSRDWAATVELLEHRSSVAVDPVLRADTLCRAAEIADARLHRSDEALRLYGAALARCRDAGLASSGRRLLRARHERERASQPRDVATLDLATLEAPVAGVGALDEAFRCELRGDLAQAAGHVHRAARAFADTIYAGAALAAARRVLSRAGRHDELGALLAATEEHSTASRGARQAVTAAQAYLAANQPDNALEVLASAVDHEDDLAILYSLARVLEAQQHWPQLAVCLLVLSDRCRAERNAVSALERAAELWSLCGDDEEELSACMALLARAGESYDDERFVALLRRAEPIARRLERSGDLATILARRAELADDGGDRAALMRALCIALREAGRWQQAEPAVAEARALLPEDLTLIVIQFELELRRGAHEQSQQTAELGLRVASTSSRRSWLLIELASVGERLPMDETRRVRWDHDALLLAVDDDERLSAAVERYRIHGRLPRLVAIGQQLLEREKLTLEAQWRLEATLQQLLQRPRVALPRARRSRRPVPARQAPGWRGSLTG